MPDNPILLLRIARACVVVTFAAHLLALLLDDNDPVASPISQLSRGAYPWIHSTGLLALGVGWTLIGASFWRRDSTALWRTGCSLLFASAALMPGIAWYFAAASEGLLAGADANDPLAVLASMLGIAMGALQPGLKRQRRAIAAVNIGILVLWIALIPVIPFLAPGWLGAYERTVGALMLLWTLCLSLLTPQAATNGAALLKAH